MVCVMAFQMFIVYGSSGKQFFISVSVRYVVEALKHLNKGAFAEASRTEKNRVRRHAIIIKMQNHAAFICKGAVSKFKTFVCNYTISGI